MNKTFFSLRLCAGVAGAGAILALTGARAAGAPASDNSDAFPTFDSYIQISGQAPVISGDKASFDSHDGMPATGSGGIEAMEFSKDLSDVTTLTFNGHAMAGSDDYLGDLKLDVTNIGTAEVGFKDFRTFYDGVGGFFPETDTFEALGSQYLHVDRSSFWVNLKLAKPGLPVFTLSFHDDIRTGMKDSSEWAPVIAPNAVVTNGALVGTAAPSNTPEIGPNVMSIDEHHLYLEGGMVATIGKVTETLKGTLDWVNDDDGREYVKYPDSTVTADPTVVVDDDQEIRKAPSFRLLSQTKVPLSSLFTVEVGLTYFHLTSENGGYWITPTYSSTAKAIYNAETAADIYGGSRVDDYVGNIFLKYASKNKDWQADVGYRAEDNIIGSTGGFQTMSLSSTATTLAATNVTTAYDATYSHYNDHGATPEASIQYLGFKNLSLYASFDDQIIRGNQHWNNPYAPVSVSGTGVVTLTPTPLSDEFYQDANQTSEDAKVGVNWNPSSMFTVRAEVFHKDHQNQFVGSNDYVGTATFGDLFDTGYIYNGAKFTVIFRPDPKLTFTTRYQPQGGEMSVLAATKNGGNGFETTSGRTRIQEISETVDWTPYKQLYVEGNLNVVYNYIETAFPDVVVSTTTYVPSPIQNANNNYIVSSGLIGFVLDKSTDAQIRLSWQEADNYNPLIAAGGQPYGSGYLEQSATAGLKHKFSDHMIGDVKAGYLRTTDATTGYFTDYRGPLAYASLTLAF